MSDSIRSFVLSEGLFKGSIARTTKTLNEIFSRKNYPDVVAELLAESVVLTALLSSSVKYEGIFTLQISSEGPVKALVCDEITGGAMRAYARFDEKELEKINMPELKDRGAVPTLLKAGTMAFTIDDNIAKERYQGIVALEGATLAECAQMYFKQSEQLETAIKIATKYIETEKTWKSAGMMLQKMPSTGGNKEINKTPEEIKDEWNTDIILLGTLKDDELLDDNLSDENILYRLYNEQKVIVFEPKPLSFGCRCSKERIKALLNGFSGEDLNEIKKDGNIIITCEFCGNTYNIKEEEISKK